MLVSAENDNSEINAARLSIDQAFLNVLTAEEAGGNVTELLFKLNGAGQLLADAENIYKSGSSENVTYAARNAIALANQINDEAIALRNVNILASQNNLWFTLAFSLVGAVVFACAIFFIWRWFKRRFITRFLDMRPEVLDDAP